MLFPQLVMLNDTLCYVGLFTADGLYTVHCFIPIGLLYVNITLFNR